MGIDRGGMCDTGESLDSYLARVRQVQKERDAQFNRPTVSTRRVSPLKKSTSRRMK